MKRALFSFFVGGSGAVLLAFGPLLSSYKSVTGPPQIIDASRYPNLQAAFAVAKTGSVIRLPAGTYRLSSPLVIESEDVLVEGEGTATHIKNINQTGQPAILVQHPLGRQVPFAQRNWRVRIANLRVTGNPQSGHGIEAIYINELFLQGLEVSGHGGHGIFLDGAFENPRVTDCMITYNEQSGLELDACHDIVVSSNQFEENMDGVRASGSFNVCLTGNCFDDHLGNGVVLSDTNASTITGNVIEESAVNGIVLGQDCYGVTLSANSICRNSVNGVSLLDAHGCAVSGNTFLSNVTNSVRIGPGSGRITLTGNNFADYYIGEGMTAGGTNLVPGGIMLQGTSAITISGNTFSGVRPSALVVSNVSRNVLVSNNVLEDTPMGDLSSLQQSLVVNNLP